MTDFDLCGTPWQHQLAAMQKADRRDSFGLFFQPGTGKSFTSILLARRKMYQAKAWKRVLVLAPPVVLKNWKDEWLAHSNFKDHDIAVMSGPAKNRVAVFDAPKAPRVIITNYESLLMEPVFKALQAWSPEILIADESHRCKNPASKRTKRTMALAKIAPIRYILTGTPVLNTPMDIWAQYFILDRGETFGTNFFTFRKTYFYDANAGMPPGRHFPDWKLRKGAVVEIAHKIANSSMHVDKADCLDLPPLMRERIDVDMSPEQYRVYAQMANDLVAYLDGKECVARIALTKALRLLQCVSGFIPMESPNDTEPTIHAFENCPREAALRDLLIDIAPASKVIVWATFHDNYRAIRRICDDLGLPFVELHGEISTAEKHAAVDRFNTDESVRVLIGHPGSGGIGVNLVAADTMIFYSRGFSLEHDVQAEARNYRGGSERHKKVTRYDIVATGTIDELVLDRLAQKMDIGEAVIQDLRGMLQNAITKRARRAGNGNAQPRSRRHGDAKACDGDTSPSR